MGRPGGCAGSYREFVRKRGHELLLGAIVWLTLGLPIRTANTVQMSAAEEEEAGRGEARRGIVSGFIMPSVAALLFVVGCEWQCPEDRAGELIKSRETRESWKSLFLPTLGRYVCTYPLGTLVGFRGSGDGNLPETQISSLVEAGAACLIGQRCTSSMTPAASPTHMLAGCTASPAPSEGRLIDGQTYSPGTNPSDGRG
jgi:hypothetical protein